ncbi:MAG: GNAT family N-acetyltransferase [Bacteroidales bacterium]|nr:GNAT family N-acetyltransferase [Bacteroidales bacterium]
MTLKAAPNSSLSSGSITFYAFVDNDSTTPVGTVDLYNYDPLNRRAAVGIAVDRNHRRQGIASDMLDELSTICTTTYSLHQLYCDIVVTNTPSFDLFIKKGYKKCATLQEWVEIGDKWIDVIRMQKIL